MTVRGLIRSRQETTSTERPADVTVSRFGRELTVAWNPAASGPAAASFVIDVTGAVAASVPTADRSVSGVVGPGTYTIAVSALNACGASAASESHTVTVP